MISASTHATDTLRYTVNSSPEIGFAANAIEFNVSTTMPFIINEYELCSKITAAVFIIASRQLQGIFLLGVRIAVKPQWNEIRRFAVTEL